MTEHNRGAANPQHTCLWVMLARGLCTLEIRARLVSGGRGAARADAARLEAQVRAHPGGELCGGVHVGHGRVFLLDAEPCAQAGCLGGREVLQPRCLPAE
jgi:hypothetical protein